MRKNYFLSLFLLMTAFWNVNATDGSKSTSATRNFESSVLVPPATPTGLSGSAVGGSGTRVNLFWTDNATNEIEYEVAYSANSTTNWTGSVWTGVASNGVGGYTLTNLQPSTTYYVAVRALKAFDGSTPSCPANASEPNTGYPGTRTASCWSNVAVVSTNASLPQPASQAFVNAISQRSATLYFSDDSNNETSFIIERSSGGAYARVATLPASSGGQQQWVDGGLTPNTFYRYRVYPVNSAGAGLPEAYTNTNTNAGSGNNFFRTPNDPPTAPVNLEAFSVGLNQISVFWRNTSPIIVNDYEVEISRDGTNWTKFDTKQEAFPFATANNLLEGTGYLFRVKSRNEGGYSPYSNILAVTTLRRVAPNASFNLSAKTISTTQIDLTWNLGVQDNLTNNRIAQEIYRSSVSATDGFGPLATVGNEESTFQDKTCLPKTRYWYKIFATNAQGVSPGSNVASALTLGPPFAPSDLVTALANDAQGNTIIKASWKDNSNDEWGFTLERAIDSLFTKELLSANVDSNTVAATSIPIEEGLTYYFRVKGSNKYGDSKYSAISKLTTIVTVAPNAPYSLKGTATAADVSLRWGDDSNNEANFEVERSEDAGKTWTKVGTTTRNEITYIDKTVKEKTKYSYRVRATNVKGNSAYTNVVEVTTLAKVSASIELAVDNIFQVYPNPTSDGVKVSVSENMLKESGVIIITDRMNREVSKIVLNPNQSDYRLDMSNYSEGTYTISIRTETQQITKRVYKY